MGIREEYSQWPLGRQMQVLFISSTFFLTLVLVIITRFQLDWLRDKTISDSDQCLEDNFIGQMRALGQLEASYIKSEFRNYISFVENLNTLDSIALGFNGSYRYTNPFKPGIIHESTEIAKDQIDYKTSVYYCRIPVTPEGYMMLGNLTSVDNLDPFFYTSEYLSYYSGYENEILSFYPGSLLESTDYTPLVREWYYKAAAKPKAVTITEPYIDATTGEWIITISKAILNVRSSLYGVSAVDISLKELTSKTKLIKILDSGFIMLVSSGGMILTMPDSWKSSDNPTLRIFDTDNTGITEDQWIIIANSSDGTRVDFNDANGTNYFMVKYNIQPISNSTNITHYILVCIQKNETQEATDKIVRNFQQTYLSLFWLSFSFGIIVFLGISLLIYFVSRKVSGQFKMVEKIFGKIIRRGLFPKMTKGVHFTRLENNSKGIETLVEACKEKVHRIKEHEDCFSYYRWGLTRPNDYLLYNDWSQTLYPYNLYTDKPMSWRQALPNLAKVLG